MILSDRFSRCFDSTGSVFYIRNHFFSGRRTGGPYLGVEISLFKSPRNTQGPNISWSHMLGKDICLAGQMERSLCAMLHVRTGWSENIRTGGTTHTYMYYTYMRLPLLGAYMQGERCGESAGPSNRFGIEYRWPQHAWHCRAEFLGMWPELKPENWLFPA
jgi:hypothetical protein